MKCAIVTGGSRGIGKAICLKIAEEHDYHLLINYNSNEAAALETLKEVEALGGTVIFPLLRTLKSRVFI